MIEFHFNSSSRQGWKECVLRHPVDVLTGNMDTTAAEIEDFFQMHRGRYIAGFISYDYGRTKLGLYGQQSELVPMPQVLFAAYTSESKPNQWDNNEFDFVRPVFRPLISREEYLRSVRQIQDHIRDGEFYQVNFTHFLQAEWEGKEYILYRDRLKHNAVRFAVYIRSTDYSVLSFSPELFLRFRGRRITTEPIKGTIPRDGKSEDRAEKVRLINSAKEAAELDMITDLLRNDLGRICKPGSVRIQAHRAIMKLEKLWHTYTAIIGVLDDLAPISAVLSCMPGGSISGCPKKRAVEFIGDLEHYSRGIYTGTIGLQYPNGDSDWSIAIRTILRNNQSLFLGVGGGITIDSDPASEYDETLAKARSLGEILP
ncbi:MAG: chorismate-binding protein [Fidelibacterota bacterium]